MLLTYKHKTVPARSRIGCYSFRDWPRVRGGWQFLRGAVFILPACHPSLALDSVSVSGPRLWGPRQRRAHPG